MVHGTVRYLTLNTAKTINKLALLFSILAAGTLLSAQSFNAIHQFTGPDGANPQAGLTGDSAGNFYGTTAAGGNMTTCRDQGCGTVFKLTRSGSGWILSTLYIFQGESDGAVPTARVVIGPDGALYGTTQNGGNFNGNFLGNGTVYKLTPPNHVCASVSCPWTKTILYTFAGAPDGSEPGTGDLIFDSAGNIYGTTQYGGNVESTCFNTTLGCGTVYKLTHGSGGWTESLLYSFAGGPDGDNPIGGVVFDQQGNLYGTDYAGGTFNYGTIFELASSGSGWTKTTLYTFTGASDGEYPAASLTPDGLGNYYGTASANAGDSNAGVVFELAHSSGGWNFSTIYDFPYPGMLLGGVTIHNGNLYGTTLGGGSDGFGSVWALVSGSGEWTLQTLYSFTSNNDGSNPYCNVVFDASGNIYGTAYNAGEDYLGTIWEITP